MDFAQSNDLIQYLVFLVVLFVTVKELARNGKKVFDDDLTMADRRTLMGLTFCLLLPLAVLAHECGHMIAIEWAGGQVKEFQYGIFWGFVIPDRTFPPFQDLVVDAAGSAMDVLIAFIALLVALISRSPSVVALSVYLSLAQVFSALFTYPLMSASGVLKSQKGWNGDWMNIYNNPLREQVALIVLCQFSILALYFYFANGSLPRLWYCCKTRPKWCKEYKAALARAKEEPNEVNYLTLAWSYYLVGLDKFCRGALDKVAELNPKFLNRWILEGYVCQQKGDVEEAVKCFDRIIDSEDAEPVLKARALMAVGHAQLQEALEEQLKSGHDRNAPLSKKLGAPALEAYDQAAKTDPSLGDPLFYKATVLNKLGRHIDAENVLKQIQAKSFLDPALAELVSEELKVAKLAIKEAEE